MRSQVRETKHAMKNTKPPEETLKPTPPSICGALSYKRHLKDTFWLVTARSRLRVDAALSPSKTSIITLSEVAFIGFILVQNSHHHWDRVKVSEYRIKP